MGDILILDLELIDDERLAVVDGVDDVSSV
jgi:hypothetical protein